MVTREEYNQALNIVEAYHKELTEKFINNLNINGKTVVSHWVRIIACSKRLNNILMGEHCSYDERDEYRMQYIENITKKDFMKRRHAGKGAWNEFVKLRGY
jgi:hypothetical protein